MLRSVSGVFLLTLNRRLVDHHEPTLFDFLVLDLLAEVPTGWARMGDLPQVFAPRPSRTTQQVRGTDSEDCSVVVAEQKDARGVTASIMPEGLYATAAATQTYAGLFTRST
ncbi:hypothetical protein K3U93_10565 [Mycobacterium malmoense]|uniref:Uncharacterized protein n=1 Tax=Mycobacterium malmoense TaxID=1780 RepID=A0ABX3SMA8_MYCMA|nr:hypothetical protein [Mycobacterium malmoense]ORA79081.1 hypothetical protein BST29_19695 [Mycobacterium malmoense]QZA19512.1 hypothetical protein K3U93_10565 [Mycobacterium malmoense]UNB96264.1 hypothetical protein H5T25_10555 [Mycobacterium malmoense]